MTSEAVCVIATYKASRNASNIVYSIYQKETPLARRRASGTSASVVSTNSTNCRNTFGSLRTRPNAMGDYLARGLDAQILVGRFQDGQFGQETGISDDGFAVGSTLSRFDHKGRVAEPNRDCAVPWKTRFGKCSSCSTTGHCCNSRRALHPTTASCWMRLICWRNATRRRPKYQNSFHLTKTPD